jgi:hypothetical protein
MQLALTRCELPLMEVVENQHSVADVLAYLQVCVCVCLRLSLPGSFYLYHDGSVSMYICANITCHLCMYVGSVVYAYMHMSA